MKEIHFETIDSTSTFLKRNYLDLDNFTFVSASFQEKGHGRMNRNWISRQNENLLFSILIKDKKIIEKFNYLSLATSCVILNILKELNIKDVSIKWPNDVYVKDKKICGILLEGVSYNSSIDALVIGIGLNINAKEFDDLDKATSLSLETNNVFNINDVKNMVYKKMLDMLNKIDVDCLKYVEIANTYNYLKDKEVYANINNKKQLVKVVNINQDGSLKVITNNKEVNINTGEITFHT